MWAPSCEAAVMLAAAELNAEGGVLDREIELTFADCGITENDALAAIDFLLGTSEVDAVVGAHTSSIRDTVSRRIGGLVPYIYTPQHEGGRDGVATVATGSTDPEILGPSIHWLAETKRAQRFFFVGNDYIWPRTTARTIRQLLAARRLNLCGELFLPIATEDYGRALDSIRKAVPDVVVIAMVGGCGAEFSRQFAAAGLDQKILRFALILDEIAICGVGAEASTNLFTAGHYFANQHSSANDAFLEAYHDGFGTYAPPASAISVGCYEGINVLAGLARHAGWRGGRGARRPWASLSREEGRRYVDRSPFWPGGTVHIAAANGVALDIIASLSR